MRGAARRGVVAGLLILMSWLITWAVLTAPESQRRSFVQCTSNVSVAVILVGPLAWGTGLALGTGLRRSGLIEYLRPCRTHSTTRVQLRLLVGAGVGIVPVIPLTWLASLVLARGSHPSPAELPSSVLAVLCAMCLLAVGMATGSFLRSYLPACAAPLALYAATAVWPPVRTLYGFASPAVATGTVPVLTATQLACHLGWMVALILAALVVIDELSGRRSVGAARVVAAAVLVATACSSLWLAARDDRIASSTRNSLWTCTRLSRGGSLACLPRDLAWMHEQYVSSVDAVNSLLSRSMERRGTAWTPILWTTDPAMGTRHPHMTVVGLQSSLEAPQDQWIGVMRELIDDGRLGQFSATKPAPAPEVCAQNFSALPEALRSTMAHFPVDVETFDALAADDVACHG